MNALSDLQLRVSHAVAEREQRERLKSEMRTEESVAPLDPEVSDTKDEPDTTEEARPEFEPRPVDQRRWWEKLINALPFFKKPRAEGISS
jgi:hypothetical protein